MSQIRPSVAPRSPIRQASPARVWTSESHARFGLSSSQVDGAIDLSDEEVSGEEASPIRSRPLPSHYFSPDPIMTPELLSQMMEHATEGAYYVVTQGLEPGLYRNWYVKPPSSVSGCLLC